MRNNVTWNPSPNLKLAKNRKISCVVLHATATSGIQSPKEWLCSEQSKVSAHYLMGKDGMTFQLVDEGDIAWHAGDSIWRDQKWVNNFSIGIELVNANDGQDEYPQPQIDACATLVASICKDYGIGVQDVIGHKDIAPGRKTDPAGFDFDDFRITLTNLGVASV